jgi:tagatose-1,6-bisphosphate aldolase
MASSETSNRSSRTRLPSDPTAEAVGRRRRLLRLGGAGGVVAGIAIDHRDSLRVMLERRGSSGFGDAELRSLKLILTRALAPAATALMLDAELGGLALESGAVPPTAALIMPLEAQGYESGDGPRTTLLDDFSPAIALRYGADACKVLLPYRADDPAPAAHQEALVISTAAACHELGLPLVVEPVVYRRPDEDAETFAAAYGAHVLSAVERLRPLGVDLLKLPFPVLDMTSTSESAALDACHAIAAACRETPWVLLGAGVATATFTEQIRLAGTAGASGFLAGRGIWGAALDADPDDVERIASTTCRADLERCRAVAERFARPIAHARID